MRHLRTLCTSLVVLSGLSGTMLTAQSLVLDPVQYAAMKAAGTLPEGAVEFTAPVPFDAQPLGDLVGGPRGGGTNDCACWREPDATYTLAMPPNDDGSSAPINLPFQFSLYGDLYNVVYINNNGNLSFVTPFGTFTSTGFPNNTNRMVAPFWADVDTRGNGGSVWYKVTPTALYVNWVGVGYFNQQTDKRNWFQVIISDGTDPVLGIGNNVGFCYLDMQWTTGSASGGVNGFGGTPATVGANRALGTGNYIQFGRFNQPGSLYDGPFGLPDGVDWLDDKNFLFTTQQSTQNIPPIATGLYLCDTLRACVGQVSDLEVTFLAPENGQVVVANSVAPTLSNWSEIQNTSGGIVASVTGQFTATASDLGFHEVTFTATDNGTPNLTTIVNIVVEVIEPPAEPLVISGATAICTGGSAVLSATPGYGTYTWSTGATGPTVTISQPGTYTVNASIGLCNFTSPPFTLGQVTPPPLAITGPATYCGTPLPQLTASPGYEEYTWTGGATGQVIEATGGTYVVTGLFQGCLNNSAPFTLTEVDPGPPVITGNALYCEGDSGVVLAVNATPYETIVWSTGQTTATINATTGTYTATATFLNCTYTSEPFTVTEVVLPPVEITGNAFYCAGTLAFLNATPGFESYIWNNGSTGPNISAMAGTYFVTAGIGPCVTSSLTFTVTEVPLPTPVITGPQLSCAGQPVALTTTEPYASYAWSSGDTGPVALVGSGTWTVSVLDQFGCPGTSAPYTVLVVDDPTAAFSVNPPSPELPNVPIQFTDQSTGNGGTIIGWEWAFGDGNGSFDQNPVHSYAEPGAYNVMLVVTTNNGCVDTLTVTYVIIPAEIEIPNVFSPNGDGVNDYFDIKNIQYFRNNVFVYNRWGQPIFEAKDYRNNWRANDVPEGTYYYVVRLTDTGREYTGHVTLLR